MEFVATYWFVWLIILCLSLAGGVFGLIATEKFYPLLIGVFIAIPSFLLLDLSIILNIIGYAARSFHGG